MDEKVLRQIADLRTYLGLSYDEVGKMLGVTENPGRTVWCWERNAHQEFGTEPFTDAYRVRLGEAHAALMRLLKIFVPRRLRLAIRRPAAAFSGERALDWILRGKIGDVVSQYEKLYAHFLSYP